MSDAEHDPALPNGNRKRASALQLGPRKKSYEFSLFHRKCRSLISISDASPIRSRITAAISAAQYMHYATFKLY
jgi:hypothetical protein